MVRELGKNDPADMQSVEALGCLCQQEAFFLSREHKQSFNTTCQISCTVVIKVASPCHDAI